MTTFDPKKLAETTIRISRKRFVEVNDLAARLGTTRGSLLRAAIDCGLEEAAKMPLECLEAYEPKRSWDTTLKKAREARARRELEELGLG